MKVTQTFKHAEDTNPVAGVDTDQVVTEVGSQPEEPVEAAGIAVGERLKEDSQAIGVGILAVGVASGQGIAAEAVGLASVQGIAAEAVGVAFVQGIAAEVG